MPTGTLGRRCDLCIQLRRETVNGIPLMTENLGYVLNTTGCQPVSDFGDLVHSGSDLALGPGDIARLKVEGAIPASVPDIPRAPLPRQVTGNIGLIVIGVIFVSGMFCATYRMIFGERRRLKHQGAADTAAVRALATMCQVAKADGHVDGDEMRMITRWIAQLTGREFDLGSVRAMLMRNDHFLDSGDYRKFAEGLGPRDREMVLHAALYVAASDGQIQPLEHQVVTDMAQGLGVDGTTFRDILNEVARLLRAGGAAAV